MCENREKKYVMKLTIEARHSMSQMENITCHQMYFVRIALKLMKMKLNTDNNEHFGYLMISYTYCCSRGHRPNCFHLVQIDMFDCLICICSCDVNQMFFFLLLLLSLEETKSRHALSFRCY